MTDKKKYDIFISHTKKIYNTELLAISIKMILECKKYNVFLDIENLIKIEKKTLGCVIKNIKLFIIIIDEFTFDSKFVNYELKAAMRYNIPIIPIVDTNVYNLRKMISTIKKKYSNKHINSMLSNSFICFNLYYRRCFVTKLEKRIKLLI